MSLTETQLTAWAGSSTSTRTNTITSGSFTPAAGSLVVVVTGCGNVAGVTVTVSSISDSVSGTWTRLVHLTGGGQFADASVWVKDAGASPSAQTVTVTMSPSTVQDVGLSVRQFTGAKAAASQNGVTATATSNTVSITPGTTGSQVVGAWGNAATANVTANGSTTFYGQTSDTGGAQEGGLEATSLSTASTPVTLGYTAAQGGDGIAVAEILPSTGTTASAGAATVSATANGPVPTVSPAAGSAAVTAQAPAPVPVVTANAGAATVTAQAGAPAPVVSPAAGSATVSATANAPAVTVQAAPAAAAPAAVSPSWQAAYRRTSRPRIPVFAPLGAVAVADAEASRSADDGRVFPQPAILILPAA